MALPERWNCTIRVQRSTVTNNYTERDLAMPHTFDDEVIINQQDPIGAVNSVPLKIVTNPNDDPDHNVLVIADPESNVVFGVDTNGIVTGADFNAAGNVVAGLANGGTPRAILSGESS